MAEHACLRAEPREARINSDNNHFSIVRCLRLGYLQLGETYCDRELLWAFFPVLHLFPFVVVSLIRPISLRNSVVMRLRTMQGGFDDRLSGIKPDSACVHIPLTYNSNLEDSP